MAKRFQLSMPALTSIILLVSSLVGVWIADSQIQIFALGDQWPDARTVPVAVLWLLAGVSALRLALNINARETPIGSAGRHARVTIVVIAVAIALWSMSRLGFLPGAIFIAFVSTLALGERRPALVVGLPVLVAAIVYFGGRHLLGIPLP